MVRKRVSVNVTGLYSVVLVKYWRFFLTSPVDCLLYQSIEVGGDDLKTCVFCTYLNKAFCV